MLSEQTLAASSITKSKFKCAPGCRTLGQGSEAHNTGPASAAGPRWGGRDGPPPLTAEISVGRGTAGQNKPQSLCY